MSTCVRSFIRSQSFARLRAVSFVSERLRERDRISLAPVNKCLQLCIYLIVPRLSSRNEMESDRSVFIRPRDLNYDGRGYQPRINLRFPPRTWPLMDVRVTGEYRKPLREKFCAINIRVFVKLFFPFFFSPRLYLSLFFFLFSPFFFSHPSS